RVGGVLMPKLADFGIAQSKLRKDDPSAPDPTDLVSTVALFSPRWAAPEQLAGGEEGPSTDVYALGLVTAYMLTARAAFADADVHAVVAPPERTMELGSRLVRVVEINERLDLVIGGEHELRFRVTLLPTRQIAENSAEFSANSNAGFAVNVKGLNCFVTKEHG